PDNLKLLPFDWIRYQRFVNQPIDDRQLTDFVQTVLLPSYTAALTD
ncbi:TetR/AcrR family transcriptional regulator, partial [Levilactobacillus brevis]|nr:TetR/AcrR family transcriptional regulator [Levilactobacillus brevis]MBS1011731.1 TetR/AcrR family transcriptional regulator [Levilactobacillus brevis]